jgi:tetratricopeptide (TPR) repeat protein
LENTHGVFLYDDTLHIPLVVAGPGVPAGKVIDAQVRSIDLLPTVAEYLGLAPHPAVQGVSLWPLIRQGKPVAGRGSNYSYIETLYPKTYMNWSELRGMRTDRWKFILAPRPELYDLEQDPAEKDNVIGRYPAEADHLEKKIWEVIGPSQQDRKLLYEPVDPQTRQELASLGYVSAGARQELSLDMSGPDPKDRVTTLRAMQQYEQLMKEKSYAQAVRVMAAAVRADQGNPLVRLYLGMAQEKQGDWRRVIETYRTAVEAGLVTDQIFSRLGKAYLRAHNLDDAIESMEKAGGMNPADLDNLRNLGNAYLLLKKPDKAENAFKAILAQDERYAGAYNGLGLVAIQRGDRQAASPNFERAIELDPTEAEPLLHLGLLYQSTGQKDQALRYFTLFLEKAPPENYGRLLSQVRKAIQELRLPN